MRLVFRQSGETKPALEITRVDYFEPMAKMCKFTAIGFEDKQIIHIDKMGRFVWKGEVYNFIELFDN